MRDKYYPPKYLGKQFHCPLCGVFASQEWHELYISSGSWEKTNFKGSYCSHCKHWTFWYDSKMIVPFDSSAPPHHPDLPEDCRAEYNEARDIFGRSPRASAALLRLCIQKLMPHLGQPGENINDDIAALVADGLPVLVQKALDVCRVVGNNAVHPGEIDLNDTPDIAERMFEMINFIVEDRITRPKEIEGLYQKLPESSREAISKRDGKDGGKATKSSS